MPDKKETTENQNNTRQDSIPGDILTQLNAESANLGQVYSSIQAIKHATDTGNSLQEVTNDFLLDIGRHVEAISSVISSLDSKMERLVNKFLSANLTAPQSQNSNTDVTRAGYALETTVQSLTAIVSEISSKMSAPPPQSQNNLNNQNNQNQPPPPNPNPNNGPGPKSNEATEQAIRKALEELNNQSRGRDRNFYQEQAQKVMSDISDKVRKLSEDFRNGNIDRTEFEQQMDILGQQAGQLHDAIQDAARQNKDVIRNATSDFSAAAKGNMPSLLDQFVSQCSSELSEQMNDLVSQFRNGQISEQDFNNAVEPLIEQMGNLATGAKALSSVTDVLKNGFDASKGENHTAKQATSLLGDVAGEFVGQNVATAIGTAIGGPAGAIVGDIVGGIIADKIGAVFDALGDHLDYLANQVS